MIDRKYNIADLQKIAVTRILELLPEQITVFKNTETPLPIGATFLGSAKPDISVLRQKITLKQSGDVKELLEPVLLAAELYEASCSDKEDFFLDDKQVQRYVFTGSKWRAGWALVLGGKDHRKLIEKLKNLKFAVFTDTPGIENTVYIGCRDTSPVYFLQLMVRYGLTWGRIKPGDDHQMGHFLEKDMPGLIIICEDLPPLKYLIVLGMMKLGAPAVVPSTFPFPYGRRIIADSISDIIEKGTKFSNLRQRYYLDEIISLPDYCNPAMVNENIETKHVLGGKADSFFCVRPVSNASQRLSVIGRQAGNIGIMVGISAKHFTDDIAAAVEKVALKSISFLSGVHACQDDNVFRIELGTGINLDDKQIGEAIYWGIRYEYPQLEDISVSIVYDDAELAIRAKDILEYKKQRYEFINNMTEDNISEFCVCTECRPFSLVHTCLITPERMPMCAARSYVSVKAAAYFGSTAVPWKRQSDKELPLRMVFNKGKLLNADKGEYEGCNEIYEEMTGGQLKRVYLHSLRDYPLTSCGCFQALAFWIDEVKGIGIMSRDSEAVTPTGQTWAELANRAGGKQCSGIVGVSLGYIRSKNFMKGDGGISNVVWVDSALYKQMSDLFLPNKKVATEKNVNTMAELKSFVTAM
jgi:acetyl-CoA decarbonylase/synthase complex subunit beta